MKNIWMLTAVCLLWGFCLFAQDGVRIKDISNFSNAGQQALIGYGLIVGLNGSGDRTSGRQGSTFTVQSISNMLERFGITVSREELRTRNAAAVMVTAETPPFGRRGARFDVTISSLGDAKSLEGGILLMTPLMMPDGNYCGLAQGPILVGGLNIEPGSGERFRRNSAVVGRLPSGGYLTKDLPDLQIDTSQPIYMNLLKSDFETTRRIVDAINGSVGAGVDGAAEVARPAGSGSIEVAFPDTIDTPSKAIAFLAGIEMLRVQPDIDARVVVNERTGTIVAGGNVRIDEVMISHGSLTIQTRRNPVISQPGPFSGGTTATDEVTETTVSEDGKPVAVIPRTTTVSDLAAALNQLGFKPRDLIAIFQAIEQAGALHGRLIIN